MALNMRRRVRVGSRQSASWRGMRGGRGSVNSLTHRSPHPLPLTLTDTQVTSAGRVASSGTTTVHRRYEYRCITWVRKASTCGTTYAYWSRRLREPCSVLSCSSIRVACWLGDGVSGAASVIASSGESATVSVDSKSEAIASTPPTAERSSTPSVSLSAGSSLCEHRGANSSSTVGHRWGRERPRPPPCSERHCSSAAGSAAFAQTARCSTAGASRRAGGTPART